MGCNGDLNSYNLFAYCGNNPVNRKDINGNFWVAALVGAAVNVATTFIAAKVTGQEYTWADFGIAALSGAVNAIPVVGTVLSGVITGTYAGYMSYANGATVGEAIFCGTVAGTLTASSISNLANISGTTLDVATTAFVDLVYGTAFNTISAATYKGITNNAQVRNKTSNNTNSVLVNKSSVPTPQKKTWKTKTYVYSYGVRI